MVYLYEQRSLAMTFFSKKVFSLLITSLLLSTSPYASQEGGDEVSQALVIPYGRAAYEAFFKNIKEIEDKGELKTVVKKFVEIHIKDLTLPVFYSHLLQAEEAEKISPSQLTTINSLVHDWLHLSKKTKHGTMDSENANTDHEPEISSVLSIKSYLTELTSTLTKLV